MIYTDYTDYTALFALYIFLFSFEFKKVTLIIHLCNYTVIYLLYKCYIFYFYYFSSCVEVKSSV